MNNLLDNKFNFFGRNENLVVKKENGFLNQIPFSNKSDEEIYNMFFLETIQKLDRTIIHKLFNYKEYQTLNKEEIIKVIEKNKNDKSAIITNGAIVIWLQDTFNTSVNFTIVSNYGCCYYMGKINEMKIYVDPYMRWDDHRIALVKDDFYNYEFDYISDFNYKYSGKLYVEFTDINVELIKSDEDF